ncbi:hypothetical protein IMZ48_14765 [Candidatus Bathyarchaeota archaeon]|nr:hypothetical protein [Candidatus Bathyarchaeota archaeon]
MASPTETSTSNVAFHTSPGVIPSPAQISRDSLPPADGNRHPPFVMGAMYTPRRDISPSYRAEDRGASHDEVADRVWRGTGPTSHHTLPGAIAG